MPPRAASTASASPAATASPACSRPSGRARSPAPSATDRGRMPSVGTVHLVGAGPGDPALLTARALELLAAADVVVHDRLVPPGALDVVSEEALVIYAGKEGGGEQVAQDETNRLLVEHARAARSVVRLKGGDPFVFGRGGEEAQALREAGIPYEVVPGVSSAIGAAAYAGIPVTHRDYASSFTVITGHEDPKRPLDDSRINWHGLVRTGGTLVFLMGVSRLGEISARLIEAGHPADTPVALVEWGTTERQKTAVGDLSNIVE